MNLGNELPVWKNTEKTNKKATVTGQTRGAGKVITALGLTMMVYIFSGAALRLGVDYSNDLKWPWSDCDL